MPPGPWTTCHGPAWTMDRNPATTPVPHRDLVQNGGSAMNRNTFKMSLLAASLLAAFGAARADTITSVTSGAQEPKCMDAANTTPAGCIPSVPLAQSSSTTTTDVPGIAVVP